MKQIFLQREGLEQMISAFIKCEGKTREEAIKEINNLLKDAEPEAEIIVLDEFSMRSMDRKS